MRRTVAVALVVVALAGCRDDDGATPASTTTEAAGTTSTTGLVELPPSTVTTTTPGAVAQPAQPATGPGGSAVAHGGWEESSGGEGADAWFVFEPVDPKPASAPVAVFMHGYFEYEGYAQLHELMLHTVRTGTIAIFPRWQTDLAVPCAGPVDIEPCLDSAVAGIRGALDHLTADADRVQPELDDGASYFGFSFGGIITTNLANRHETLDLPRPRVVFLDDPHDGGLTGTDEPALDDDLTGIPDDVLFECHVGAQGVIAQTPGASCNALFPRLGHIPPENRALVMTRPDDHGEPALAAGHGVCSAAEGQADAYDWGFCWKVWDALREAAATGTRPTAALADTPEHLSTGEWSDGPPVAPLEIAAAAPIG